MVEQKFGIRLTDYDVRNHKVRWKQGKMARSSSVLPASKSRNMSAETQPSSVETQPSSVYVNDPDPDLFEQNQSNFPSFVYRLSKGNVFRTYKEFQDVLELYHQSIKVPFVMNHAKTVE